MLEFGGDITVRFVSNRGFTHELVRHRVGTSFAQESTRYCNYGKNKFEGKVTFVRPDPAIYGIHHLGDLSSRTFDIILEAWAEAEKVYLGLVKAGVSAEVAREVLPIGVKSEIDIKANIREWRHILALRTSKKAHPRMRELMVPLLADFKNRVSVVFDNIG
jgi:thymidylate synthase (FAD)